MGSASGVSGKSLSALGLTATRGGDVTVTGLALDNRRVAAGDLFAALPGSQVHGARFAAAAIEAGAGAVLTDRKGAAMIDAGSTALIVVEDPRAALAQAAALWFGAQPETIVAVTGTNGKTSVASFTRQIWASLGYEAASIGTIGVEGAFSAPGLHTTPDPLTLHRVLAEMQGSGITHVAMEASSHGLDQRRMDGVHVCAAAFTNLSQDHLDYHHTMEAYAAAKLRLFQDLLPANGMVVANIGDPVGARAAAIAADQGLGLITVADGIEGADFAITDRRLHETGQTVRVRIGDSVQQLRLDLIGGFQALNALQAAALVVGAADADLQEMVFSALPQLQGVRGRMQLAAQRSFGAPVFVDYAHTPDALVTALRALRPHVMGRLHVVFGAGGDRDQGKRPLMGRAAAEHADRVIVTDDNPRSEMPAKVRSDILVGCPDATEIGDRAEAILRAVAELAPGDALLVAGKGHETGQQIGDVIYPFDDVEQASLAVAALEGAI
ncbi:MAG: UDP-N-acetylmuramoyl-L-alanyl-D-glutamate--2,6-diaminopimelate ligase [Pseudomonadota bacterium]